MCYYITATLPETADLGGLRSIGRRHGVALEASVNASLQAQLLKSERQFLTTTGHCDCGTVLGLRRRDRRRAEQSEDTIGRRIVKLRKDRWSEAKIQRWRDQHSAVDTRKERVTAEHTDKRTREAQGWQQFVSEAILLGGAAYVGLLLHWYGGSEPIRLLRRHPIQLATVGPDLFFDFEDDVLYTFRQ
jgi:hypothetical protein